ncbi:hypothetical protein B0T16DRAFT_331378 [Cercophora newfieldiana]|uniref:RBR-type E3 ubiquitin transferase n=1 Tax=Cercophora newfieldiana TaxID=92897 RepID=A0AA39Y298_9PEZI|nr:hypothetical protein B0T16DRAFT_331378 [Cercophora newfieldiana]
MSRRLRRTISSLLHGGKNTDTPISGSLSPIPEVSPADAPLNNDSPEPSAHRALVDSLRKRTAAVERGRNAEKAARVEVEQDQRTKTAEADRLVQEIERDQANLNRERVKQLEVAIEGIRKEKKGLERDLGESVLQCNELEARLKEYRIWSAREAEEHKAKDGAIATLQAEKEGLARLVGVEDPVAKLLKERLELDKMLQTLQAELAGLRRATEVKDRLLKKVQLHNQELGNCVTTLGQELEVAKARVKDVEASTVLDASLTPRILIVTKLLLGNAGQGSGVQGSNVDASNKFLRPCLPCWLTSRNLDIPLTPGQAKVLMATLVVDELMIIACDVCMLPKLTTKPGAADFRPHLNEFVTRSRPTPCCAKSVCKQCCLRGFDASLSTAWWENPDMDSWVQCPVSSCAARFGISSADGLATLLKQLGDKDVARHMEIYNRAEGFRRALLTYCPGLSDEASKAAASLHNHLVAIGRMHPLFDPAFPNRAPAPDETGHIPAFDPGSIRIVNVDQNGDNSINVPLFTQFLRRQETPKSCIICTDDFPDIHTGSAEEWLQLCEGSRGTWMWDILSSPLKLELECQHPVDFCTACLRSHLKAQLEQHGRGAAEQLSCPSAECHRKLSYQEIRLYGDHETFTQYDKYLQLDALSRLPKFRWCLGPGCSSGQVYDDDDEADGPIDPHMYCQECGFEMCYVHSVPWHEGQTCEQYDSVRTHGDPEFHQTQNWIKENTKPCPGCGENIQKGEWCFHMTCTRCRFEYCWECLAEWKFIAPNDATYIVQAHKSGCPFRTNGLIPTQVTGENMQDVMRRTGRNRR